MLTSVLHVVGTSHAVPFQVLPFARRLRQLGITVDIASPSGREIEWITRDGFHHIPIRLTRNIGLFSHLDTVLQLARVFRARHYDVIHLHGPIPGMLGRIAALVSKAKTVYHCRGATFFDDDVVNIPFAPVLKALYPTLERIMRFRTDLIYTLNQEDATDFVRNAGYRREQVICLGVGGFGVDTTYWNREHYSIRQLQELRIRYNIPSGHHVIGFVGRLVREKGILELLDAFNILRTRIPNIHLMIVGNTPASERDQTTYQLVQDRLRKYQLNSHVTLLGHLDSPRDAIVSMDVLCLPSHREGFGQVIAEAAALGIPSVAVSSRGTRQAIDDGITGLLVSKGDILALVDALDTLLNNSELRQTLGTSAMIRVRRELNQHTILQTVYHSYFELVTDLPPGT